MRILHKNSKKISTFRKSTTDPLYLHWFKNAICNYFLDCSWEVHIIFDMPTEVTGHLRSLCRRNPFWLTLLKVSCCMHEPTFSCGVVVVVDQQKGRGKRSHGFCMTTKAMGWYWLNHTWRKITRGCREVLKVDRCCCANCPPHPICMPWRGWVDFNWHSAAAETSDRTAWHT